jgi:hypothetical protein
MAWKLIGRFRKRARAIAACEKHRRAAR